MTPPTKKKRNLAPKTKLKPKVKRSPVKRNANEEQDVEAGPARQPGVVQEPKGGVLRETPRDAATNSFSELDEIDVGVAPPEEPPYTELGTCTGCMKEKTVCWDDVDGLFVCHNCGQSIEPVASGGQMTIVTPGEEQLVNETTWDARGQSYGTVHVGAEDTGTRAAMNTMSSAGARRAVQHAQSYDATIYIKKYVHEYGDHLKLTAPVLAEASGYASRIHRTLPPRSMRLTLMALAGLYASIRMNKLPLTLVDLVAIVPKGDLNVYSIGRAYRQALLALNLKVPHVEPSLLIPKLLAMLLELFDEPGLDRLMHDTIQRDAGTLLGYISGTELRAQHPTVLAATSIYLAIEMNMIPLPKVEFTARAFHISETALKTKANNIRHAMAREGQVLSFGHNITAKNAMKYARVIMKLSTLKRRAEIETEAWGDEGQGSGEKGAEGAPREETGVLAVDEDIAGLVRDYGDDRRDDHDEACDNNAWEVEGRASEDLEDVDVEEYLRTQEEVEELRKLQACE